MTYGCEYYAKLFDMIELPEGGRFAPVHRGDFIIPENLLGENYSGEREAVSVIYYLLKAGEVSKWHLLEPEEYWMWHAGGTLEIKTSPDDSFEVVETQELNSSKGAFVVRIPPATWQSAVVKEGEFVLVSCVVSPGYHDDEIRFLPED